MLTTLNELSQLERSGFGQPSPRHGLDLLYWFAHDYIDLSYAIVPRSSPQNGEFGFHKYQNRIEDDEDHIVPIQNLPYYEVGNLNIPGAQKLPPYVKQSYRRNVPASNMDRIIVRQDPGGKFDRVYVTEHSDSKRFDSSKTYRVSRGLLQIIKNMSRDQYLKNVRQERVEFTQQSLHTLAPENDSWCSIL